MCAVEYAWRCAIVCNLAPWCHVDAGEFFVILFCDNVCVMKILKSKTDRQIALAKKFYESIEKAWQEYKSGKFISHEDLEKKLRPQGRGV